MKMEIIESDLKQIFQWIKNHDAAIRQLQDAFKVDAALAQTHQDAIESLEERIINIELLLENRHHSILELLLTQEDNK